MNYLDVLVLMIILEGIPFIISLIFFAGSILYERKQLIKCSECKEIFTYEKNEIEDEEETAECPECGKPYNISREKQELIKSAIKKAKKFMIIGIIMSTITIIIGLLVIRFLSTNKL